MNLFDSIRSSLRDVEKFIDLCRALSCTCFHRPDGNYAQLENYEKGEEAARRVSMKERGREQLVANVRQPFVMLGYRVLVHRSDFINSRAEHLRRVRMLAYLPSNCQPNTCYPNNPTIANFAQRPRIYKHIDNRPHREIFHSRQSFSRFYTNVATRVYTRVNSLRVYIFHGCAIVPLW